MLYWVVLLLIIGIVVLFKHVWFDILSCVLDDAVDLFRVDLFELILDRFILFKLVLDFVVFVVEVLFIIIVYVFNVIIIIIVHSCNPIGIMVDDYVSVFLNFMLLKPCW
jgi:hypothetical protein